MRAAFVLRVSSIVLLFKTINGSNESNVPTANSLSDSSLYGLDRESSITSDGSLSVLTKRFYAGIGQPKQGNTNSSLASTETQNQTTRKFNSSKNKEETEKNLNDENNNITVSPITSDKISTENENQLTNPQVESISKTTQSDSELQQEDIKNESKETIHFYKSCIAANKKAIEEVKRDTEKEKAEIIEMLAERAAMEAQKAYYLNIIAQASQIKAQQSTKVKNEKISTKSETTKLSDELLGSSTSSVTNSVQTPTTPNQSTPPSTEGCIYISEEHRRLVNPTAAEKERHRVIATHIMDKAFEVIQCTNRVKKINQKESSNNILVGPVDKLPKQQSNCKKKSRKIPPLLCINEQVEESGNKYVSSRDSIVNASIENNSFIEESFQCSSTVKYENNTEYENTITKRSHQNNSRKSSKNPKVSKEKSLPVPPDPKNDYLGSVFVIGLLFSIFAAYSILILYSIKK